MLSINLSVVELQWLYHVSTTFVVCALALTYYLYERYLTARPNKYNRREQPKKLVHPIPAEAKPHWKGKRLHPPHVGIHLPDPTKIQSYCPATGQYLGTFTCKTPNEMDAQIAAAAAAQKPWAESLFAVRKQLLRTLAQHILDNQEDIARVACRDSGKTKLDALMGEIMVTLEKIEWIVAHGERALRPLPRPGPSSLLLGLLKNAEVRYEPLGVVGAIVLWNYPFHNLLGPVVAALFSGNAIVVKCSEQVVWLLTWFVGLVHAALRSLGLDEGLVQLVYCFPEHARHFSAHEGLRHLTFIGSQPVAKQVLRDVAPQLTPCVVELGGKDAVIVLDSVRDYASLASVIMRGTFQSAGQNCIGIERVVCLPGAYEALVPLLAAKMKTLRVGSNIDQLDEIDVGAMISGARFAHLEALVADAVRQGATLVAGGAAYTHPNYPQGHYFEPTMLTGVTPEMRIANEEVFGPVLTVMRADTADAAVAIANGTEFGLGGSVFGSHAQCLAVAQRLECGNVAINDFATFYVCQLPFGGVKKLGYGKFGGEEGLTGLCNCKSVVVDRPLMRALGVRTKIPPPLDYPIRDDKKAWLFVRSLNTASYDYRAWNVAKALRKLAL